MVKLPSVFRAYDKQLHAAFYFLAAAMLNMFFAKRNFLIHLLINASLFCMGIVIEYAQQYSNRFFANRIHGRFDPEDVKWNLIGLIIFSGLWIIYTALRLLANNNVTPKLQSIGSKDEDKNQIQYCPHCGKEL